MVEGSDLSSRFQFNPDRPNVRAMTLSPAMQAAAAAGASPVSVGTPAAGTPMSPPRNAAAVPVMSGGRGDMEVFFFSPIAAQQSAVPYQPYQASLTPVREMSGLMSSGGSIS